MMKMSFYSVSILTICTLVTIYFNEALCYLPTSHIPDDWCSILAVQLRICLDPSDVRFVQNSLNYLRGEDALPIV